MVRRVALLLVLIAATVSAQPSPRRATNLAALTGHPVFYHLRPIVIVGAVKLQDNGELRVSDESTSMRVLFKGTIPDGMSEVRGEFWDVGRMNPTDPQLAGYDLKATFQIDPEGAWPRPGQVTAIVASAIAPAVEPAAPSVRNVVLYPARYLDQRVTIVGQFGGRNLLGDLPDAPAQSRYDFVLRSADAAIWVTNIRPRGKDFELALDARIDTGRWLEVSGTLQQGRGLQWLDGKTGTLILTQAPKDTPDYTPIRVAAAPPPEVIFSAPTSEETDVPLSSSVRIQFSRDIDATTLKDHIHASYRDAGASANDVSAPGLAFTAQYLPGTRVLELRFASPFERFRTVAVELQDGILGRDKQPLSPWTLTFQTGA